MRFVAFALGALGGLFGLWLWAPTALAVYDGTEPPPEWSAGLRVLLLVGLMASVLGIVGAILSVRRSPLAWVVLALGSVGMMVGLGYVYFIGLPSAIAMAVAAVLANGSRRP